MVVSNMISAGSQTPATTMKVTAGNGPDQPAATGNRLPVQAPAQSEIAQNPSAKPNPQELQELVSQANRTSMAVNSNLKFTVAEGTDINVVRVEDTETGELIRQIPSEQMIAIARALEESSQGMMLAERV